MNFEICFSTDPLDSYNFDSTYPDVSKYINDKAAVNVVTEEKFAQINILFLSPYGPLLAQAPMCTIINDLVTRVMHTTFGHNWARTFKEDVENMNSPHITLKMYMIM